MRSSIAGALSSRLTSIAAIARSGWFADRCAFASCCTTSRRSPAGTVPSRLSSHGTACADWPRSRFSRASARSESLRRRERDDAAVAGDRALDLLGVVSRRRRRSAPTASRRAAARRRSRAAGPGSRADRRAGGAAPLLDEQLRRPRRSTPRDPGGPRGSRAAHRAGRRAPRRCRRAARARGGARASCSRSVSRPSWIWRSVEQLGDAVLDAEQVREPLDHLEVVRRARRARCDTCRSPRRCRRARRSRAARRAAACRGACA